MAKPILQDHEQDDESDCIFAHQRYPARWLVLLPSNMVDLVGLLLIHLVMYDFEELLMHSLSVVQAREMLLCNRSTSLAHFSCVGTESPKANLLNTTRYWIVYHFRNSGLTTTGNLSDVPSIRKCLTAVKFTSGSLDYIRDSIDSVQILHYKSVDLKHILDNPALSNILYKLSLTS